MMDPEFLTSVVYPLLVAGIIAVTSWGLWISILAWRGVERLSSMDERLEGMDVLNRETKANLDAHIKEEGVSVMKLADALNRFMAAYPVAPIVRKVKQVRTKASA